MFCQKKMRPFYTVRKKVSREGVGLFTGAPAVITFLPLPAGSGVFFQRVDLPGAPKLPLSLSLVQGTPRCTLMGNEIFSVQTVEHLLAALHAYEIRDLLIELSGPEVPIFDGSSQMFVQMLEEAQRVLQGELPVCTLTQPVYFSQGDTHLIALPSDEFRISYTLHYPHSSCIGTQFFSAPLDEKFFQEEISPCRTFSVYEEIAPLIEKGFLKGGSLKSALVIKEDRVMNPEGMRRPCEMVRHKILDMIGDLYLVGKPFSAHILAVRSGHHANNVFANELLNHFKRESF